MIPRSFSGRPTSAVAVLAALSVIAAHGLSLPDAARGQGIALQGVGPVNRAMAGASTAAPIDSAGAIHWNPATISGLRQNEVTFGLELLLPEEEISSRIDAGALGGGFPAATLAGSDTAESGVAPIPTVAWVHRSESNPSWTYGLGMFGVAGFRVNYPASLTNPILMPQNNTPGGFGGLGRIFADLEILQIVPTASYAVTDQLAIGVAPVVSLGRLSADPLFFAAPDDADGSGVARYPSGLGTRYHWGGGAQIGIYYIANCDWHFGASLKSPQWFESFRFRTTDEAGAPRTVKLDFDYPMIASVGAAYNGVDGMVIAIDARYFDYANTDGFDSAGFAADGSVTGLGWNSIFSVSTGVQYELNERMIVRAGYTYQQNPFSSTDTIFNVASPLIIQHVGSVGASYALTRNVSLNAAYVHGFPNSIAGPLQQPGTGPIAGTEVASRVAAYAASVGATVRY